MQRVMVLGPSGSGKSTLAVRLGESLGLPVTHLDPMFWTADWTPAPRSEAVAGLDSVVAGERWVIDGDFLDDDLRKSGDRRLARAELVVWLDLPAALCLARAVSRWLRSGGRSRPDLPVGGRESFDPGNLADIVRYPRHGRPQLAIRLAALPGGVRVERLRTRRQVRDFLAGLHHQL